MPFVVEYRCEEHGNFEKWFKDSSETTKTRPCPFDEDGNKVDEFAPAAHGIECDRIFSNLRIKTDQGWEGGLSTPLGVFDSKQKYLDALTATGRAPREPGMSRDAKRIREGKEAEQKEIIHKRVVSTYVELNGGKPAFVPTHDADAPLYYQPLRADGTTPPEAPADYYRTGKK